MGARQGARYAVEAAPRPYGFGAVASRRVRRAGVVRGCRAASWSRGRGVGRRSRLRHRPYGFGAVALLLAVERAFDESLLVGEPRCFGAVLDAGLAVDVREVELHGLLGDPQLLRDLVVREAAGERYPLRRIRTYDYLSGHMHTMIVSDGCFQAVLRDFLAP